MANDTNFIDLLERRIKLSMHTQAPARVISFNEGKQTADVELLFLSVDIDGDTEKYPMLQDVPVSGMRYRVNQGTPIEYKPSLKKDDVVFVSFAERALDNLNGTAPFDPGYSRTHDIRDAVITGIISFAP